MLKLRYYFITLLICCLLCGCSRASVRLKSHPKDVRTLFIGNFINKSFLPGANRQIEQALYKELKRNTSFYLSPEQKKAHLLLSGAVTSLAKLPAFHNRPSNANQYDFRLSCWIKLQENPYKKNKNKQRQSNDDRRIFLWQKFSSRLIQNHRQDEKQARKVLIAKLARNISRGVETVYANVLELAESKHKK